MLKLQNASLLKTDSFYAGKWLSGKKKSTFPVINPADNQVIATVANLEIEDAKAAIEAADRAFPAWKALTPKERGEYLLKWKEKIHTNWEDLSTILTYEEGKPYEQSTHEFMGCSGFLSWYAEEAKRQYGHTLLSPDPKRRFFTFRQPIGPVAVITPWNFPSVLLIQKCAPALAAGCTVVVKPAEDTPLSALALAHLAEEAGFPEGVFNVITCQNPEKVGKELCTNPKIRKVTFTGSTAVGKHCASLAALTVKNTCLELGGNCPAIIFEDADLEKAVEQTFWPKFYNAGQCCNNINRFLVQEGIYHDFVVEFQKKIETYMKLGPGMDKNSSLGPLINAEGIAKVEELITDATNQGGKVIKGGKRSALGKLFYEPTLLTNLHQKMRCYKEEIFGPVAPIYSFTNEKEAIAMANDTHYGLAAYLFSENIGRTWRVAEALEAGSIGVNTCDVVSELLPFGGWKESGIGRENGITGSLHSYLESKSMVIGNITVD